MTPPPTAPAKSHRVSPECKSSSPEPLPDVPPARKPTGQEQRANRRNQHAQRRGCYSPTRIPSTSQDRWGAPWMRRERASRSVVLLARADSCHLRRASRHARGLRRTGSTYPPHKVRDQNSGVVAANGQYILVRRAAYEAVGGHAAVADRNTRRCCARPALPRCRQACLLPLCRRRRPHPHVSHLAAAARRLDKESGALIPAIAISGVPKFSDLDARVVLARHRNCRSSNSALHLDFIRRRLAARLSKNSNAAHFRSRTT
jgi:hypothetical protein